MSSGCLKATVRNADGYFLMVEMKRRDWLVSNGGFDHWWSSDNHRRKEDGSKKLEKNSESFEGVDGILIICASKPIVSVGWRDRDPF